MATASETPVTRMMTNDTVQDETDNCQVVANADQANADNDGVGDLCDPDRDGDGVANAADNCPASANPDQADADSDGVGNACDPLTYGFTGFFQPVDNLPIVNKANAGSAIPVKFSLGGNQGLDIFAANYPRFIAGPCDGGPTDVIEQTVTANQSGLLYDAVS